ncbi:MAG TPA: VOC family protein [Candidatus Binatia bacterium]|jgi:catechol 2,3-dioxygenase-like lactoylglutathione lyase family enzyme|nr:VOC family protein [Candidatus Binatia bacterium]
MLLGLDHIVIAVNDLAAATDDYRRLGFTVVPGGRHPVGTYNGLIAFADGSYIELISFYRDNPDHRWWDALKQGEGLIDFCMRTDDLGGDTEKFRQAGVDMDDPVPWSRTRPDGYELKWRLSLARGRHRGVAPFLIEDVTPREERVPRDVEHPNGASGIAAVLVAVDDLPVVKLWYEAVLGSAAKKAEESEMKAEGVFFSIGSQRLELLTPAGAGSPIAARLLERGPSPFAATLRGNKKTPRMDLKLTHGAALWFV